MSAASRFARAFNEVLSKDLDRRILVALDEAGRPLRYEELRRLVGSPRPQSFQYRIDHLLSLATVSRRLTPEGKRHISHYQPTPRGHRIAGILRSLGNEGHLPVDLPEPYAATVRHVLRGEIEGSPAA